MTEGIQSLAETFEKEEAQKIQDEFSRAVHVGLICLDAKGQMLTKPSFADGPISDLLVYSQSQLAARMLDDIGDGSIEDISTEQYVSEAGKEYHAAALAIRIRDELAIKWLVLADSSLAESQFWNLLDLLRDTCNSIYSSKMMRFSAEVETARSQISEAEMQQAMHTLEATTAIVQLLDNNAKVEQVMQECLMILGNYLKLHHAHIFRINEKARKMDLLAEYDAPGTISPFDEKMDLEVLDVLLTDQLKVISTDNMGKDGNPDLRDKDIYATMVFPLLLPQNRNGSLLMALNHNKEHTWTHSEVKFTADAARVLQSILVGRINKNSVAGSFHALEEVLNNVGAAVYLTSKDTGKIIFVNRMLTTTFEKEWREGTLQALVEKKELMGTESGSYEIFHPERERFYDLLYKNLHWVDGSEAVLYSLYDITDRKQYQRKIEQQAFTDFLTGLYNRMCCERDLARMIDEARKESTKGALVYLDLDDFKHINDGLGHQYGDVLLKSISNALRRINGIENTCYRMGGDEFVILVAPKEYEQIEKILDSIREVFSKPWFLKDTDYYCTSSIGVVTFPDLGDSVADLIKKADIAMYEAKKTGKNRLARYSEGQASVSGRRLDMEKNMRDAETSDYNEFEVYYQPIVDIESGKEICVGAEALVRWNSIRLGFIPPSDFIPLAEYLGLINPIGNHVLKEACKTCKSWNDLGYDYMKVNVNLSVVQLLQNDIVELVEQTIRETGINPKRLCLEVTESLAINDMTRMLGILTRIKELGVSIALDDFGTGYSSLNHIREIPFDIIKVDQSFVRELADDAYSQSFVKMVAELAQTIGVKICVEGIEYPAQYQVVKDMKVKYIQGYYFDKPLTRKDFEAKYLTEAPQLEK